MTTSLRQAMNPGRRRRGSRKPVTSTIETPHRVTLREFLELSRRARGRFEPGPNPELLAFHAAIFAEIEREGRDVAEWRLKMARLDTWQSCL